MGNLFKFNKKKREKREPDVEFCAFKCQLHVDVLKGSYSCSVFHKQRTEPIWIKLHQSTLVKVMFTKN